MNIILYKTTDPKIKVTKTLTSASTITGEPHEMLSDVEFKVKFTINQLATLKASNYAYVADLGKYFYLSPNVEIENQTVIATFKEDVLMSNASKIRAQTCTISKNENIANAYLYDSGYQLKSYNIVSTKIFPAGLTNNSIILMTIG